MSIKLMSAIWDDHSGNLNGIEKAILLRMADYASDVGTSVFPSINRLMLDTGFSKPSIIRHKKSLEEKGYIKTVKKGSHKTYKANTYKLNVELIKKYQEEQMAKKLLAKSKLPVDKSVKNMRKIEGSSISQTLDPSISQTLDPSVSQIPHPSYTSPIYNRHHEGGQHDDFYKNDLVNQLIEMKVNQKDIVAWIKIHGVMPVRQIMLSMREYAVQKGIKIANEGSYMRRMVEEYSKKRGVK